MTRRSASEKARYEWLHTVGVCTVTGRRNDIHVAHIRTPDSYFGKPMPGTGIKPHWLWTVPLCPMCHREQHKLGERAFWERAGFPFEHLMMSPLTVALVLEGYRQIADVDSARMWLQIRATIPT